MGKNKKDYCLEEICSMKETAVEWMKAEMCKGVAECSLPELSEVADVIKDLAEAEKLTKEAQYFCNVNEAMEAPDVPLAAGYNYRHLNNGQFASSGRGHIIRGYEDPNRGTFQPVGPRWEPNGTDMPGYGTMDRIPYDMMYMEDPEMFKETMRRYGYHDGMMNDSGIVNSKYGSTYDNYQHAKKYYHDGDVKQKDKMRMYANEHMSNLMITAGEMFQDADQDLQKKMISSVEGLLAQWKSTK